MHRAGRRREDHQAVLLRNHQWRRVIRADVAAAQADVEHVDDAEWLLPEVPGRGQIVVQRTGIVDEDVEPPGFAANLLEQRLHLRVVTMIDAHGNALAPRRRPCPRGLVDRPGRAPTARLLRNPRYITLSAIDAKGLGRSPTG